MRHYLRTLSPAMIAMAFSTDAFAHASDSGLRQLLPTHYYIVGGTLAVALSVLILAFVPQRHAAALFRSPHPGSIAMPRIEIVTSLIGLMVFAALVRIGFTGTHDPLENLLPLTIWTLWWVALPLLCGVFGNLWALINPWSGVFALRKRFTGRDGVLRLPERVGYAPAIMLFLGFAWYELVFPSPEDPEHLAATVGFYIAATFAFGLLFGWEDWSRRGECFSVFFRFISRLAPVQVSRDGPRLRVEAGFPGFAVPGIGTLPLSGAVFILLTLSTVSFDGLNKTFWWLDLTGVNPLQFPGRSAVMQESSIGLIAAWLTLTGAFLLCVGIGMRHARDGGAARDMIGPLALSILPISLAYHFSHYLTVLMVNGQYAVAALQRELGWAELVVTTSFLNVPSSVERLWQVQSGAIVAGHIVAVLLAHAVVSERSDRAGAAGAPFAVLMVGYTAFGLWLLASPTGA